MCCRQLTSSWFLGWDAMMCVEPVRSAFGVDVMNFGTGSLIGATGLRGKGPPQHAVNQLCIAHIAEAPRKWRLLHGLLRPQGYMDNRIWKSNKINQYHLSVGYFWGLWKGQSAYFFKLFSRTRGIYCSCDGTWSLQDTKKQQICAILNLYAAFNLSFYVRATTNYT